MIYKYRLSIESPLAKEFRPVRRWMCADSRKIPLEKASDVKILPLPGIYKWPLACCQK
jgi:hypothetical protein